MNLNKFFTLLMGKCWHEFFNGSEYVTACIHCKHHYGDAGDNPDHLSNPLPVLEWMRENMADTLEQALAFIWQDYEITETFTVGIFRILNLQNLAAYLIANPEWGERECPEDTCIDGVIACEYGKDIYCKTCHGTGTILHPALEYALSEKGGEDETN
jgi:hypothetical protein